MISQLVLDDDRPGYVYRAYDRREWLLYIGSSLDVPDRMAEHRRSSPWFAYMARHTVTPYPTRLAARAAEDAAIRAEVPVFNYTENRDGWRQRRAEFYAGAVLERPKHTARQPVTEAVRQAIRDQHADGTSQLVLARDHGLSTATVNMIVRRQRRVRVPGGGYAMVAALPVLAATA